jgi:hypothetical protein
MAVATLSADPLTMDELEAAVRRFAKVERDGRFFSNLRPGSCAEPYDAGLVVVDLVARLIVVNSTYSSPVAREASSTIMAGAPRRPACVITWPGTGCF